MTLAEELRKRYSQMIFWGHLNTGADFTHIYRAWSRTLRRLGVNAIWLADSPNNASVVVPGTWVTAMDTACQHLPVVHGVDYVLHNFSLRDRIEPSRHLNLQVFTDQVVSEGAPDKWGRMSWFDRQAQLLIEPWGCDLMPHEFHAPVRPVDSKKVYWVGSIWNNEADQGNETEIETMRRHLETWGLHLEQRRCDSDEENAELIRASRIAPAIAGRWQKEVGYLPCRMFKNIAYGHLGITNVAHFYEILGDSFIDFDSLEDLIDQALSMGEREWRKYVTWQQDCIAGFDYASKMSRILRAFDEIR